MCSNEAHLVNPPRDLCLGIGEGLVARYERTIALPPRPRGGGVGAGFFPGDAMSSLLGGWH